METIQGIHSLIPRQAARPPVKMGNLLAESDHENAQRSVLHQFKIEKKLFSEKDKMHDWRLISNRLVAFAETEQRVFILEDFLATAAKHFFVGPSKMTLTLHSDAPTIAAVIST